MISQKKVLLTGSVLILLFLGVWISSILENSNKANQHSPIYGSLSFDKISELTLQQGSSGVHLRKDSLGVWEVAPLENTSTYYRADSAKVVSILDKIEIMKTVRTVTSDRSDLGRFGLDDAAGIKVKVFNSKHTVLANFMIGNKAQNWRNTYMIKEGVNEVVEASGSISYAFKSQLSDWRDNIIPLFSQANLAKLTLSGDSISNVITISRNDDTLWNVIAFPALPKTITNKDLFDFLMSFNPLVAADWDYANSPDSITMLSQPTFKLEAELLNGDTFSLAIGNKLQETPRFYMQVSTANQTAYIYNAKVEGILFSLGKLTD